MSVIATGDSRVMEQLGEKQDFESELSRLGYRHEDFSLKVRNASVLGSRAARTAKYAVRVVNRAARQSSAYWGGPRANWIAQFAEDLAQGIYGQATDRLECRRAVRSDPTSAVFRFGSVAGFALAFDRRGHRQATKKRYIRLVI